MLNNTFISMTLVIILLLILTCMIVDKKTRYETTQHHVLRTNDINHKLAQDVINAWFSGILTNNKKQIVRMMHSHVQIDTLYGRGQNHHQILNIINQIDIKPSYNIKNIHINKVYNRNNFELLTITHDLYQEEDNAQYRSMFTMIHDHKGIWKVVSWGYTK